jgi:hypothetical protein
MNYLLYLKLGGGLLGALGASVFYWCKGYSNKIEKPTEDLDGNFLVTKVGDLEGFESDGVILAEPESITELNLEPESITEVESDAVLLPVDENGDVIIIESVSEI